MKLVNSYKIQIVNTNLVLRDTISIYRNALSYLINVIDLEYNNISYLH